MNLLDLYFDRKHILNVNDYPHFLISGSTGSGKSYFANELVIQAIIKGWQVVICDLKRSYGLYKGFTDYSYEIDDILVKLKSVEAEMNLRMKKLQPELDKNPKTLAVDIGYKPMLVVIEEYISLQASLDKKQKEELERVVKNISVLARQSNIHMMIVLQSAGTENINSTTRSNLTKVLLGNAQSNILSATFGTGVDLLLIIKEFVVVELKKSLTNTQYLLVNNNQKVFLCSHTGYSFFHVTLIHNSNSYMYTSIPVYIYLALMLLFFLIQLLCLDIF